AIYGMAAARYMSEFHVTAEQLASVSVKNHRHGFENPRAQRRRLVTLEEVMGARMISDPLTVLQCCAIADGSAAAIVGGERSVAGDVRVRASALRSGNLWDHRARKV